MPRRYRQMRWSRAIGTDRSVIFIFTALRPTLLLD
jgi:hypothetical protein